MDGATPATGGLDPGGHLLPADGYPFGDLLALARRSWVQRLSGRAASAGFADFRRSDTVLMRILVRGPAPIGQIGEGLGVTRQAARKLADGLVSRGYAELADDPRDARRRLVRLTDRGLAYHRVLADAALDLDREVHQLAPSDLRGADAVLRAVLTDQDRRLADAAVPPPRCRTDLGGIGVGVGLVPTAGAENVVPAPATRRR